MVEELVDPRRQEPSYLLPERQMLEAWLEFHRTTLLLKCEGLGDAELKSRPVETSKLSLHGLLRHLAEVERSWFRRTLLDEPDAPPIWYDPEIKDSELVPLDDANWQSDLDIGKPNVRPAVVQQQPMNSTILVTEVLNRVRSVGFMST